VDNANGELENDSSGSKGVQATNTGSDMNQESGNTIIVVGAALVGLAVLSAIAAGYHRTKVQTGETVDKRTVGSSDAPETVEGNACTEDGADGKSQV
jgi:hypothetical protein